MTWKITVVAFLPDLEQNTCWAWSERCETIQSDAINYGSDHFKFVGRNTFYLPKHDISTVSQLPDEQQDGRFRHSGKIYLRIWIKLKVLPFIQQR